MFFKTAEKLESKLMNSSSTTLLAGALCTAFTAVVGVEALSQEGALFVANMAGIVSGSLVILRQAGMKNAAAMKKLNILKSSAACVQYGIGGNGTGVIINLTSIGINRLYLSTHAKSLPENISLFGKNIKSSFAIAVGGAGISTALSLPFIAHAYSLGGETSFLKGAFDASVQSLPLVANYLGIAAASRTEGKNHRILMGGAGAISVAYDLLTQSYGLLLASVGSVVGTGIGWYKHDRKPKQPAPSP